LLSFVYGLARARESVFEITVEDPAPGFERVSVYLTPRPTSYENVPQVLTWTSEERACVLA